MFPTKKTSYQKVPADEKQEPQESVGLSIQTQVDIIERKRKILSTLETVDWQNQGNVSTLLRLINDLNSTLSSRQVSLEQQEIEWINSYFTYLSSIENPTKQQLALLLSVAKLLGVQEIPSDKKDFLAQTFANLLNGSHGVNLATHILYGEPDIFCRLCQPGVPNTCIDMLFSVLNNLADEDKERLVSNFNMAIRNKNPIEVVPISFNAADYFSELPYLAVQVVNGGNQLRCFVKGLTKPLDLTKEFCEMRGMASQIANKLFAGIKNISNDDERLIDLVNSYKFFIVKVLLDAGIKVDKIDEQWLPEGLKFASTLSRLKALSSQRNSITEKLIATMENLADPTRPKKIRESKESNYSLTTNETEDSRGSSPIVEIRILDSKSEEEQNLINRLRYQDFKKTDPITVENLYNLIFALNQTEKAFVNKNLPEVFSSMLKEKGKEIINLVFSEPVLMHYLCRDVSALSVVKKGKWSRTYRIKAVLAAANEVFKNEPQELQQLNAQLNQFSDDSIITAREKYVAEFKWFSNPVKLDRSEQKGSPLRAIYNVAASGYNAAAAGVGILFNALARAVKRTAPSSPPIDVLAELIEEIGTYSFGEINADIAQEMAENLERYIVDIRITAIGKNIDVTDSYIYNAAKILALSPDKNKSDQFLEAQNGGYTSEQRLLFIACLLDILKVNEAISIQRKILKHISIQLDCFKKENGDMNKMLPLLFCEQHFNQLHECLETAKYSKTKDIIESVRTIYAKCVSPQLYDSLNDKEVQRAGDWMKITGAFSDHGLDSLWPDMQIIENKIDNMRSGSPFQGVVWKEALQQRAKNDEAKKEVKKGWRARYQWLNKHSEVSQRNFLWNWMAAFWSDERLYLPHPALPTSPIDLKESGVKLPHQQLLSNATSDSTAIVAVTIELESQQKIKNALSGYIKSGRFDVDVEKAKHRYLKSLQEQNKFDELASIYIGLLTAKNNKSSRDAEGRFERFLFRLDQCFSQAPECYAKICIAIRNHKALDTKNKVGEFINNLSKVVTEEGGDPSIYVGEVLFDTYKSLEQNEDEVFNFLSCLDFENLAKLWGNCAYNDQQNNKNKLDIGKKCLDAIFLLCESPNEEGVVEPEKTKSYERSMVEVLKENVTTEVGKSQLDSLYRRRVSTQNRTNQQSIAKVSLSSTNNTPPLSPISMRKG
jgi:hypothetical protein